MQLKYSEQSLLDLREIKLYLQEKAGNEVALNVIREIRRVIGNFLLENPRSGVSVAHGEAGLRFFPAGKYHNYNIYYTIEDDLLVVRVLYGKRDIKAILQQDDS